MNHYYDNIRVVHPPNLGWLEKTLSVKEVDFLWNCINQRKSSVKQHLAGNIHESNDLIDEGDWFFQNTLFSLVKRYESQWRDLGGLTSIQGDYHMNAFWVNFQKEYEFNPCHNHGGIYSFVIWMQVPTRHEEQNHLVGSNSDLKSAFQFNYLDILGGFSTYTYEMNPEVEGTLIFFPSQMIHVVYPFFNNSGTRISISGNITLKTH